MNFWLDFLDGKGGARIIVITCCLAAMVILWR